jgi:hypothetical protein
MRRGGEGEGRRRIKRSKGEGNNLKTQFFGRDNNVSARIF